jgi:hypothetical protein
MQKTQKAELFHEVEKFGESTTTLPEGSKDSTVFIRDAMPYVHGLQCSQMTTFGDVASVYTSSIGKTYCYANTFVEVFDSYSKLSPNDAERSRRSELTGLTSSGTVKTIKSETKLPSLRSFLSSNANKKRLTNFLAEHVIRAAPVGDHQQLFLSGGRDNPQEVVCITPAGCNSVEDLSIDHEEADTRLLFHATLADASFSSVDNGRIIIQSCDTDVIVLCIHYFSLLVNTSEMWLLAGTADKRRFVPIHTICINMNPILTRILPAVHALTGTDTTSAFYKKGKKCAFKAVNKSPEKFLWLVNLAGIDTDEQVHAARNLVVQLYDPRQQFVSAHGDLNLLRAKLSSKKMRFRECAASLRGKLSPTCEEGSMADQSMDAK